MQLGKILDVNKAINGDETLPGEWKWGEGSIRRMDLARAADEEKGESKY